MLKSRKLKFLFLTFVCTINFFLEAEEKTPALEYDAIERLTSIDFQDSQKIKYAYDLCNNRIEMTDSHGTTKYFYDESNHLIKIEYSDSKILQYNYDGDNLTKIVYPDNTEVAYSYD